MASGCKNSGALSSCRLDCNKLTRTATISAKLSTSELHVRTERNEISACRQSWLNAAQKKNSNKMNVQLCRAASNPTVIKKI